MTHELKTWPVWFEMVRSGRKTFELRVNDRNFQPGDTLLLREWDPHTHVYSGSEERRVVADIIDLSPLMECVALIFMDDASGTLRAEVDRLRGELAEMTKHRDIAVDNSNGWRARKNAWKARAEPATAHAADLRAALEDAPNAVDSPFNGDAARDMRAYIRPFLARTPAQSLAALKARVLDAAATVFLAEWPEAAEKLRREAAELEKQA